MGGGGKFKVVGGGGVCFHFFNRLILVGVTIGLGFCVSGKSVRCKVT